MTRKRRFWSPIELYTYTINSKNGIPLPNTMHYYQYGTARLENNQAIKHDERDVDSQTDRADSKSNSKASFSKDCGLGSFRPNN